MLIDFIDLVKSTGRMIAGHNIIGFDINFIRKRFFINGLTDYLSDKQGNDVYMKPWLLDQSLFDTMVAWKGSGFANTSLEELTMVFGIPTSKDNCHGNEVTEFYYSGRIKEIQTYCEKDVASVANLVRVWKGDSILEPIIRQDVQVEELPLLQRIYKATSIDSATKEKIQEKLSKAKPTKKDREILYDILTSLYINNAMFSSDKEDIKEQKRKEIKDLLNLK
jgi:DNA polymerase III epsilon subunit-like protein